MSFSVKLETGPSSAGNWFVRKNGQHWSVASAGAGQSKVELLLSGQIPDVGPDVVSYSPPPFDVLSDGGQVPAPAFADYPLV